MPTVDFPKCHSRVDQEMQDTGMRSASALPPWSKVGVKADGVGYVAADQRAMGAFLKARLRGPCPYPTMFSVFYST